MVFHNCIFNYLPDIGQLGVKWPNSFFMNIKRVGIELTTHAMLLRHESLLRNFKCIMVVKSYTKLGHTCMNSGGSPAVGHGCFGRYLCRVAGREPDASCHHCDWFKETA